MKIVKSEDNEYLMFEKVNLWLHAGYNFDMIGVAL
jgi:hypothetical protein